MPHSRRLADVAAAAAAIVVLIVLVLLKASLVEQQVSVPSTYDTGPRGYAAVYDLLSREGLQVTRYGDTISQLFSRKGILVLAGDDALVRAAGTQAQAAALEAWVHDGGTLAVFGSSASLAAGRFGIPPLRPASGALATAGCGLRPAAIIVAGNFSQGTHASCENGRKTLLRIRDRAVALAYRRGKGTILFISTPSVFDNEHLAQRANAQFAYTLLSGGTVMFDERIYGYANGKNFWQVLPLPMRAAILIASATLLVAIVGANLPFAPPNIPDSADARDSGEYITSLARMLEAGGAQRAVVQRLCAQMQGILRTRASSDERARDLLDRVGSLESLSGPRTRDVLAAGRLFARVRKEYGW